MRPITNLSKLDAQLCFLSLITFFGLTELMEKAFEVLRLQRLLHTKTPLLPHKSRYRSFITPNFTLTQVSSIINSISGQFIK